MRGISTVLLHRLSSWNTRVHLIFTLPCLLHLIGREAFDWSGSSEARLIVDALKGEEFVDLTLQVRLAHLKMQRIHEDRKAREAERVWQRYQTSIQNSNDFIPRQIFTSSIYLGGFFSFSFLSLSPFNSSMGVIDCVRRIFFLHKTRLIFGEAPFRIWKVQFINES